MSIKPAPVTKQHRRAGGRSVYLLTAGGIGVLIFADEQLLIFDELGRGILCGNRWQ